ncbi:hypothetical protein RB200_21690 [Streptomyces sp. PmtG]
MRGALLVDAGGVLFNNVTEDSDFLPQLADWYGVGTERLRQEIDRRDAAYETNARGVFDVLADALAAAGAPGPPVLDRERVTALYLAGVRASRPVFDTPGPHPRRPPRPRPGPGQQRGRGVGPGQGPGVRPLRVLRRARLLLEAPGRQTQRHLYDPPP